MAWIESHQTLWRHPKTQKAARLAGVNLHEMIGLLHCLWWWSLDYAEDGRLDGHEAADIEAAVGWAGEEGKLWSAWVRAGFIDQGDAVGIHDWDEYAGRLLEKRAESRQRAQMSRERARTLRDTSAHGARNVHPYNQPTKPTNQTNQPDAPESEKGEDDLTLIGLAHGRLIAPKITLEQSLAYENWLKLTTPQAIIAALETAAAKATKNGGKFKYAMSVLQSQRDDHSLPLPARPQKMDIIDDMPEEGPSWL